MTSSLSVAMIVRNEASQISECLATVRDLASEVCVVDTGSGDGTPEIARGAGAVVSTFEWCDDFAAARNASLDRCRGDWVFVLDADERIAAEDIPALREAVEGPRDRAHRFTTRNYTRNIAVAEFHVCRPDDPLGRGFAGWFPGVKARLFPNRPELRFEGAVHELIDRSIERAGLLAMHTPVPIHHYPLTQSAGHLESKRELYVRLGLKKAALDPSSSTAHYELGNQFAEMQRYAEAAKAYRECLRIDADHGLAMKDLGGVLYHMGRLAEAEQALRLSVRIDPGIPDAWRNLGVLAGLRGDWAEAVNCHRRAIALLPDWGEGHRYLGVALEHAGRLGEALDEARRAMELDPGSGEPAALVAHLEGMKGGKGMESRGL